MKTRIDRRSEIWKHNSFLGRVAQARTAMNAIIDSTTATPAAKRYADEISGDLGQLYNLLKVRNDPE